MAYDRDLSEPSGEKTAPSTEREWRLFERQYGRWLKDNAYTISAEEGKLFKSATYTCFGAGLCGGIVTSLALNRSKVISRVATRRVLSAFVALYSTAICINRKRRSVYTELLNSPGRLGNAARHILIETQDHLATPAETKTRTEDLFANKSSVLDRIGDYEPPEKVHPGRMEVLDPHSNE
ncbi:hydroxymethylbilane synthase, putative [Babesia ovata]|uniref:Hydroxymethylbilane synthase, putative n=1 Tax=Babesia ovata TaxID=189622 RepID=A0A2H6KI72_9APIC|nr:hydroxymethylbilane synthase, putative [Babesia ovata]GBE62687.1 hydroxymethylbilane synthase, putative [Babesia ovata]